MPDIAWNHEVWDRTHGWEEDGDEWSGMAVHCHQPYDEWKAALVRELLEPNLRPDASVVEVAPGHGRFTEAIVGKVRTLTLVDLSQTCLDICRRRFGDDAGVSYVLTDGTTLPGVPDGSVDFIWSFDSFVHMEREVIDAYLAEFARVLKPGGSFLIHHAGKRAWSLKAVPVTRRLGLPGRVLQRVLSQGRLRDQGCRANVSKEDVAGFTSRHGMLVSSQFQRWGDAGQYTVEKYRDIITSGRKPG